MAVGRGHLDLRIITDSPLPASLWPEISVLMTVCQKFSDRSVGPLVLPTYDDTGVETDPTVAR